MIQEASEDQEWLEEGSQIGHDSDERQEEDYEIAGVFHHTLQAHTDVGSSWENYKEVKKQ